jgi:hydrogenase small subunit
MDEPPGGKVSSAAVGVYGRAIRALRTLTQATVNKEPKWRHPRAELTTGYHPRSY